MASLHGLSERHRSHRIPWLRASVLGANDGIVSTASLIVGVAAAQATHSGILVAGLAGLVAGSMSMAAGEYVSVSSQRDTEQADLHRERRELETDVESEREELAGLYVSRGLTRELARQVAEQLMAFDAIGAHARDELGISSLAEARPVQAAFASAASFASGAGLPLLLCAFAPNAHVVPVVALGSLICLALLGGVAARTGGASIRRGILRVSFWGAFAMALTAGAGAWFGSIS
jgi:VIT1/CCC1 family predicted Fe2+/Mn2+ transporter